MEDMEVSSQGGEMSQSDQLSRYQFAGEVANKTMQGLVAFAAPGKRVLDLCVFGDTLIEKQCETSFKSKSVQKGVAFPTCVSVNEVVCHYSPLSSDTSIVVLKEGDVVKVDLGVHIDGFISVLAHTFVIPAASPVTGPKADLIAAAYTAAEASLRLMRPGKTNKDVTDLIKEVAESFGVQTVQGVLMHRLKRFVIDGNEVIIQREELDQKVDSFEFELGGAYTVDIVLSTGEGKPIQRDYRTTVFKRSVEQGYSLKMKASKSFLAEASKRFSTFPFTLRAMSDEKQARMGVVECLNHQILSTFPVLCEKAGEFTAHFKFTVFLLSSGVSKLTGLPVDMSLYQTDKQPSDAVKALLEEPLRKKKVKQPAAGAAAMETD